MDESSNIAAILPRMAAERGEQVAMRCPGSHGFGGMARYDSVLTYAQLEARSNAIAAGLGAAGLARGQRAAWTAAARRRRCWWARRWKAAAALRCHASPRSPCCLSRT